jgi:TetR/AcrR family transcriptional repressor of mexJK operon
MVAMSKSSQDHSLCCPKGAGRPNACEVEARMNELVITAGNLFLKHGYTKVSLEAIARQAHVAVRTIYVKFGGKAGLLNAVLESRREKLFNVRDMETDTRPFKEIIDDFARHFIDLLCAPEAISMQRVVIAEARDNPELAQTFYEAGPKRTRDMLDKFFARPEIRAQLRADVPLEFLPAHLTNTVAGDQMCRFLFPIPPTAREDMLRHLDERLELFYRSVLR